LFCMKCGKENVDNSKFCTSCGAPVSKSTTPSQPVKHPRPPNPPQQPPRQQVPSPPPPVSPPPQQKSSPVPPPPPPPPMKASSPKAAPTPQPTHTPPPAPGIKKTMAPTKKPGKPPSSEISISGKVNIGEALLCGFTVFFKNIFLILLVYLIIGSIILALGTLYDPLYDIGLHQFLNWGAVLITYVLFLGVVRILMKLSNNQKVHIKDLFAGFISFFTVVVGTLFYLTAVAFGFVLLVIPGIFLMIRFQYYLFLIYEKRLGSIESLQQSFKMTKDSFWPLLGLSLILSIINSISVPLNFFPSLITAPISVIAVAKTYYQLTGVKVDAKEVKAAGVTI